MNLPFSQSKLPKQRDSSLDAVSGLLILFMMYCHLMFWSHLYVLHFNELLMHIFMFYMPWFFFKGGMFAKADENLHSVISKSFHRLIVPYIVFSLIGVFVYWLDLRLQDPVSLRWFIVHNVKFLLKYGTFNGNLPLWFLLTLFFVRLLFNRLVRFRYADFLLALLILALYLFRYLDVLGIGSRMRYPYTLYNTIVGLAYYQLGYRLWPLLYHRKVLLSSLIALALLMPFTSLGFDFRSCLAGGDFLLTIVFCLSSCIVAANIFRWFYHPSLASVEAIVSPYRRLLIHLGEYSMEYLCTHWIIITILHLSIVVPFCLPNGMPQFVVYLFGLLVFLPMVCTLIRKI